MNSYKTIIDIILLKLLAKFKKFSLLELLINILKEGSEENYA